MLNKKYIFVALAFFSIVAFSFVTPYTAPNFDSVNFSLCSGYIPPTFDSINFTLGEDDSCITDTCTYPGSGDWEVDCNDNCSITSNVDLGGNDLSILGHGTFVTIANITNVGEALIEGDSSSLQCEVTCLDGGCFK